MLATRSARRVYRIIPSNCNKIVNGYIRGINFNFPNVITNIVMVYSYLFEALQPIIKCINNCIILKKETETRIMLFNLRCVVDHQEPHSWPWPNELFSTLSKVELCEIYLLL